MAPGLLQERLVRSGADEDAEADVQAEQAARGERRIEILGELAGVLGLADQLQEGVLDVVESREHQALDLSVEGRELDGGVDDEAAGAVGSLQEDETEHVHDRVDG